MLSYSFFPTIGTSEMVPLDRKQGWEQNSDVPFWELSVFVWKYLAYLVEAMDPEGDRRGEHVE